MFCKHLFSGKSNELRTEASNIFLSMLILIKSLRKFHTGEKNNLILLSNNVICFMLNVSLTNYQNNNVVKNIIL